MITDEASAHRFFSGDFFNRAWQLLDKPRRTPEETERMISLSHAALAHWRLREDCTKLNLSIGCWQLSRIYALAGQVENAKRYGEMCLAVSGNEPPFYLGYAHEALARVAKLEGNHAAFQQHFEATLGLAAQITDKEERQMLEDDLNKLAQS